MSNALMEERRRDLAAVEKLMDNAQGRRVAYRLLKLSGCLDRPAPLTDAALVTYHEGRRSIGFELFADIMEIAPKRFMVMILEAQERELALRGIMESERELIHER